MNHLRIVKNLPSTGETLMPLIEKYVLFSQVEKGTADNYRNGLKHYLENCRNPLSSADVHIYIERMKKAYSPLTVSRRVAVIRQFCKFLNDHDYEHNKVHLQIQYNFEYRGGNKDVIPDEKFAEMLKSCDLSTLTGLRDYAFLRILQSTAMRIHEPISCNVEDIKIAKHPSGEVMYLLEYTQKGGHRAIVRLFDKTYEALHTYLQFRDVLHAKSAPLFAGHSTKSKDSRFDVKSAERMIRMKMNLVGLIGKRYTAHSFRYTQAIKTLIETGDENKASQQLRHKSPKTIQYYTQDYRNRLLGENMLNLEV